jgi:hypothetical protein
MPSFVIRSRTTDEITETTVEAETREQAIDQTVTAGATGTQVEILSATEVIGTGAAPGPTALAAEPAEGKKSRAELNEMTKEELLAEAEAEGVEVSAHWNKAEIVDAIVKHK